MIFVWKGTQVCAQLGEHGLRRHGVDPIDRGQVHSHFPPQLPLQIESRFILALVGLFGPAPLPRLGVSWFRRRRTGNHLALR